MKNIVNTGAECAVYRLLWLATVAASVLAAGPSAAQVAVTETSLRFDGVYRSDPDTDSAGDSYCAYLRFYPKGGVVAASSECTEDTPRLMRNWFTWTKAQEPGSGLQRGSYLRKGAALTFVTQSDHGKVSYQGTVAADTLQLTTRSHINGHVDVQKHVFVDWSR
jgi:hypothetical protein